MDDLALLSRDLSQHAQGLHFYFRVGVTFDHFCTGSNFGPIKKSEFVILIMKG